MSKLILDKQSKRYSALVVLLFATSHAWAGFEGPTDTFYGISAGGSGGAYNAFFGSYAGDVNTGSENTFMGAEAGFVNTTGGFNTFVGAAAGGANTTGNYNAFFGRYAGVRNTTGSSNTFLGMNAGHENTTGHDNIFLGTSAGISNTTGQFNTFVGSGAGYNNTGNSGNTFVGESAGFSNSDGGYENTFVGRSAGRNNSSGFRNTFLGEEAGFSTTTAPGNSFLGSSAGYSNTTGRANTYVGENAGYYNNVGSGNVFLGWGAGNLETGSNKLYIANTITSTPLIYGEFDNRKVVLNGNLEVVGQNAGLVRLTDVTADATTKGARLVLNHYNNAALPVYLFGAASTPGNNFLAFGGGNAIGNAATQLDFFTGPTTTTATGTSRMTITGNGNIGMGVTAPAHPLHMASGALVTAGGVWTNASSRDYKENIQSLSPADAALTLAKLNPVTYNYKVDKNQGHVGFIAEDVPELVATKDRKGLSPMDIVAVLTKVTQEQQRALQEQQQVNQEQQKIIAELTEQNKLLPLLSTALNELKREVRMGRTTALAD